MTKAKAHANIALMKYWGKIDESLALPYTSSLSLTLDALYTVTSVDKDPTLKEDRFILNDVLQGETETRKISNFVDFFRKDDCKVHINSQNFFPTAAGLASSASGFAALAVALNHEFEHNLDLQSLSRITRKGSGSAARSLFPHLAIWQRGDDVSSFAYPFEEDLDIEMLIAIVNSKKKTRSSRSLMKQTVEESPFYFPWVEESHLDFERMKDAIKRKDIHEVGRIAERNALMMHASLLGLKEPFFYFEEKTLAIIERVRALRDCGLVAYCTMDAGPNVKIITNKSDSPKVLLALEEILEKDQIIHARSGPGAEVIS